MLVLRDADYPSPHRLAKKTMKFEKGDAVYNSSHFFTALMGYVKVWQMHAHPRVRR